MIIFYMFLISQTCGFLMSPEGDVEGSLPHLSPLKVHRHDLKSRLPYGINDFATMVKDNYLIVDKTPWIAEALTGPPLKLITRPRRFGRSTNLSMLKAFLTKDRNLESMDLFAGFSIQNDTKFESIRMEHQHKYAVLHFTFVNCCPASTASEFENELIKYMKMILARYLHQYRWLFEAHDEQDISYELAKEDASLHSILYLGYGILILALRDNGYKIAVLVDDYDAPLQTAFEKEISATEAGKTFVFGELYEETENLMRQFYTFFFKGGLGQQLDLGIMIGINTIDRILSDCNDVIAYTNLDDNTFGPYFGFLQHEVKWLIDSTRTNLSYRGFEEWYDGYHFHHNVVFNPFSVVSALTYDMFDVYWAESGCLNIIRLLFKYAGRYGMLDLHFLLSGQSLRKKIYFQYLTFTDLIKTEAYYWTFLTNAGYIDSSDLDIQSSEDRRMYSLRIPNKELRVYLMTNFKAELEEAKKMYDSFVYSFNHLKTNASDFQKFLIDRFNTPSSYYKVHEYAGLETLVNVFESLFIGVEFNHRSLGTLNMNDTPVYQILFIKKDIAHVFNIAEMTAIYSHINIDQLLSLPLTEENLSVMKNRRISQFFKTGIKISVEARKTIDHETFSIAIKTIVSEGMQLIKDHLFPHTHG